MRLTDERIGAELRELRDTPSERFAAELDAWVAEGFPSLDELQQPSGARRRVRNLLGGRPLLSASVAAVLIVLAVSVSIAVHLHDSRTQPSALRENSGETLSAVPNSSLRELPPGVAGAGSSQSASGVQPAAPGSRPRNDRTQIQQLSAALGLATRADAVQRAADGVVDVTNRYDGFVDSSDVHVGGRQSHASFSLRIPATHVRDALDDLSGLGRVTVRDEGSNNVTGAYVDTGKAFREARSRVDSLLAQLRAAAPASAQAASIRERLFAAREELAGTRTALRETKQRVTYAPVTVQIKADAESGSWSIGDAADDAVGVLEAIGGGTLVTLAVLVPLSALLLLGWLGARELGRRRREATLDR